MSDSRGIGQSPRFSDIYQQFKSDVPFFQNEEHVRAYGEQLYLRSGWDRLITTETEQERREKLQAGANCIREAIDGEYGHGVADVIFAKLSATGLNLDHGVTRGDLEQIHTQINRLLDAEHVRGYGEHLVLLSGQDRRGDESQEERKERWQAGSDHVRQAIDKEYSAGLGSAIFSSLSRSAGHDLHQEVTRGDLGQIDGVLGRRQGALGQIDGVSGRPKGDWDHAKANIYNATSQKIEALSASGFRDVSRFAKELAELRDNAMWGATQTLQTKWDDLRGRVDEAYRKSDLVLAHNRGVPGLKDYFEETLEYCDVKIGPGYAGPKILALEEEFRLAAGRVRQETTTSNADDLGRLRDDAIQKAEKLRSAVDAGRQVWDKLVSSVPLDATHRQIELLRSRGGDSAKEAGRLQEALDELRATIIGTGTGDRRTLQAFQRRVDNASIGQPAWDHLASSVSLDATRRKIELLRGWSDSAEHSGQLRSELDGLRYDTVHSGKANPEALRAFQQRVDKALDDWTKVHRHNTEMYSLRNDDDTTAHIRQLVYTDQLGAQSEGEAELSKALVRLDQARANAKLETQQVTTEHAGKLDELRNNVRDAANEVKELYQKALGDKWPVDYFAVRTRDLLKASEPLVLRAAMVPSTDEVIVALQQELLEAKEAAENSELSALVRYENADRMVMIANKLIALRKEMLARTPSDGNSFTTELALQAGQLTEDAKKIVSMQRSGIDGATRSDAALKLLTKASGEVLQRLHDDTRLSLLQSLFDRETLPKSGPEAKDDPFRMGLRKLYGAMKLDPGFVKQDNALRERAVDALVKLHGKDFQYYRDNWSIMTTEQRQKALQQVLEAHCGAMGVPVPKLVMGNALDEGAAGHYNPKTQVITIATSNAAFKDFEAMMDTVFHENTHHYQNVLPEQADNPVNKEFPTLVKILETNMRRENAYVKGGESPVIYKQQPIEAHAWWAGTHGTSLLLQRLDALPR